MRWNQVTGGQIPNNLFLRSKQGPIIHYCSAFLINNKQILAMKFLKISVSTPARVQAYLHIQMTR